ncbi:MULTISPECIES: hypothetical protein [Pseudomonas]|uniref:hypothetical protein n=1 Tax=Pseudomonas TaxID=286 RepID=UPI000F043545|nr:MULTISPECIES: hypothetical protein [Pseudomonas]MBD8682020.1 hypothetical protein [Pseudomonas sp. CFBP 13719]
MQPFVFSFDLDRYYGLELHAGTLGFDVFRGYLIGLLRDQADACGRNLVPTSDPSRRGFGLHEQPSASMLKIELTLSDDEHAFAHAVGMKLLGRKPGNEWQALVIDWLLNQEGLELWDSMPRTGLDQGDVTYELDVKRGAFLAVSAKVAGTDVSMAIPPAPYRFC